MAKDVFTKPYSKEFRGEVLAAYDRGRSTREAATYHDVSDVVGASRQAGASVIEQGCSMPNAESDTALGSTN